MNNSEVETILQDMQSVDAKQPDDLYIILKYITLFKNLLNETNEGIKMNYISELLSIIDSKLTAFLSIYKAHNSSLKNLKEGNKTEMKTKQIYITFLDIKERIIKNNNIITSKDFDDIESILNEFIKKTEEQDKKIKLLENDLKQIFEMNQEYFKKINYLNVQKKKKEEELKKFYIFETICYEQS